MSEEETDEVQAQFFCLHLDEQGDILQYVDREGPCVVIYPNKDVFHGIFDANKKKSGEGVYLYFGESKDEAYPDFRRDLEERVEKIKEALNEEQKIKFDEVFASSEEPEDSMPKFNSFYHGYYVNGEKSGVGSQYISSGVRYTGDWHKNLREGKASVIYPNGNIFCGRFSANHPHGKGVYDFSPLKHKVIGLWEAGELQQGKWIDSTFPGETRVFIGRFKPGRNGPRRGNVGVHYYENGNYEVINPAFTAPKCKKLPCGFNFSELLHNDFIISSYDVIDDADFIEFEEETKVVEEFNEEMYFTELFDLCDVNESGQVTFGELEDAMETNKDRFPPEFVEGNVNQVGVLARFKVGDINKDQLLTLDEFKSMMRELKLSPE